MKTLVQLKKSYGQGTFSRLRNARYLGWEDAFDVQFEDGLSFLEPHSTIRKANGISPEAVPVSVAVDEELGSHFKITYDTGEVAEVSWAFIRELPPAKRAKRKTLPNGRRAVALLFALAQCLWLSASAQVNSGSNGSDGAFRPELVVNGLPFISGHAR